MNTMNTTDPTNGQLAAADLRAAAQEISDQFITEEEIAAAQPYELPPLPMDGSLKLGDDYDAALIGATITGHFAYSLTKLAAIEADMRAISVEAAREIIAAQVVEVVRNWGAGCPVFIDDSLVVPDSEVSKIIVPGSAAFPGVEVGGSR